MMKQARKIKVVIAMDSMKGSLSSLEAGRAAAEGIRLARPEARIAVKPLADGGEGTVEALTAGLGGEFVTVPVHGPLGEAVTARYGILPDGTAGNGDGGSFRPHAGSRGPAGSLAGIYVWNGRDDPGRSGKRMPGFSHRGSAAAPPPTGERACWPLLAMNFWTAGDSRPPRELGSWTGLRSARLSNRLPELEQCRFRIACDVFQSPAGRARVPSGYTDPRRV